MFAVQTLHEKAEKSWTGNVIWNNFLWNQIINNLIETQRHVKDLGIKLLSEAGSYCQEQNKKSILLSF